MAKQRLSVTVVLDRSGSMGSTRDSTISAFNEYVNSLKLEADIKTRLTLLLFDSTGIDTLFNDVKVEDLTELTRETYVPGAMTPLYDAIASGVITAEQNLSTHKKDRRHTLVVITDGFENKSMEHTQESVKALLDTKQSKDNWQVIYLGANQDAFKEGGKVGTKFVGSMNYAPEAIVPAMAAVARSTVQYSHTGSAAEAKFTDKERLEANS